jgi:thiamine-phosphate pyrophosphorylase
MNQLSSALKVYFIMGSTNCLKDPVEVLREAIAGGITLFQYREKGEGALQGEEKYMLGKMLQDVCREHSIPFIVNDDLELALALGADGVHIGQEDERVEIVRGKLGDGKILGVSVHNKEEAHAAIKGGADYFGIGPVFPTTTKLDAKAVQGTKLIKELREEGSTIPIVGIGGITVENAASVVAAGADGVSVITAISHAKSPLEAARTLRMVVEGGRLQ